MKVFYAGITHPDEPEGVMEAAAINEISGMKRGFAALDTIITLSPLLGLLGTIIGMINAFHVMASSGLGQPHAVTGGVAEALVCTAAGISVAVVALIPYNYFLVRVERESDLIETMAKQLEWRSTIPPIPRSHRQLDNQQPP
jgi:biopolymer transport protein ExbB